MEISSAELVRPGCGQVTLGAKVRLLNPRIANALGCPIGTVVKVLACQYWGVVDFNGKRVLVREDAVSETGQDKKPIQRTWRAA